ncbi:hypothetical protein HMPREF1162_0977 [ [[Propionibacterium] namnetense SK182B-JCVI]|uniref:Uncharacterized protein n=1 Tax=[Propionibacterium] namnetense SK182B-JCVI TaxID=1051006 RepID=F9NSH4_9ACTN|nr:hypothetical protein HMPREF1162_0977 [ [[Propionibacterium] namnetense SK182B-JCVI]
MRTGASVGVRRVPEALCDGAVSGAAPDVGALSVGLWAGASVERESLADEASRVCLRAAWS